MLQVGMWSFERAYSKYLQLQLPSFNCCFCFSTEFFELAWFVSLRQDLIVIGKYPFKSCFLATFPSYRTLLLSTSKAKTHQHSINLSPSRSPLESTTHPDSSSPRNIIHPHPGSSRWSLHRWQWVKGTPQPTLFSTHTVLVRSKKPYSQPEPNNNNQSKS